MVLKHGYGILKKFKSGYRINIIPTFRCNLSCDYCANCCYNGKRPRFKEISIEEWFRIIDTFYVKVREVVISGGEPMLRGDEFVKLVNGLIDRGKFVSIWSNLKERVGLKVKPSVRIRWGVSYHRSMNLDEFKRNLSDYRKLFRVDVCEIETNVFSDSYKKKDINRDQNEVDLCLSRTKLYIAPNGTLHSNYGQMCAYAFGEEFHEYAKPMPM